MKKAISVILAVVTTMSMLLVGCGSSQATTSSSNSESSQTEGSVSTESVINEEQEVTKIVVTYMYQTATPEGLSAVQDAVNEITIPNIGVEVEFKALGVGESFTNYSLWISGGEQVDLMMIAFQDIKTYANTGQIEPLDDLLTEELAPTLVSLINEYPIANVVAGETYGISPVGINYGDQAGLIIKEEYLEETGYEQKDIYTMEDLEAIFALIQEAHPDTYPFGIKGSDITTGSTLYAYIVGGMDMLGGGNVSAGVLMDTESTEVVNLFETEEYKAYLSQVAEWYKAGYIMPDAATTDSTGTELLSSGKIASYGMMQKPEQFGVNYGFVVTGMATNEGQIGATSNPTRWCVPITSKNPEAAIKFLDYTFENHDFSNLIMFGIVGEHVEVVDSETGLIDFANGYDATTSPYYNTLGFWGDRRYEYTFSLTETREAHEAFTNGCYENVFKSYGFVFDSSNVNNQLIACQAVLDQYQKALETGSLGDSWEATYDRMISQLNTAGIYTIIEECQSQLDAYLGK